MLFLIEYNRKQGQLVTFTKFSDEQRKIAAGRRLQLELLLNHQRIDHEVVLLHTVDENAVRRTHRRYFEDLSELLRG
jgi:hypothetical protein